jgi:hypothetical protein
MRGVTYNMVMDPWRGFVAMGKDGRTYTMDEVAKAEAAAKRGDAGAKATMAVLDHTGMSQAEIMESCPCCREERERTGHAPEPVMSWNAATDPPFEEVARDPNWWMGKKRRRRARHRGRR